MSANSNIEWTDATWNPTRGCDKISPGCGHCYAHTFAERWRGVVMPNGKPHAYFNGFDPREAPEALDAPLHWKKPRKIFVNSMSDLFHDAFSDEYIARVFAVMALAHQHTFQILTKRPERMRKILDGSTAFYDAVLDATTPHRARWPALTGVGISNPGAFPLRNVWLGVSVEDQKRADERIPLLLDTPAAVRFLSCEPLLGSVALDAIDVSWEDRTRTLDALHGVIMRGEVGTAAEHVDEDGLDRIDWVIVGGESGPGARPCDVAWIRSIVEQCKAAGTPVFVKQLGAMPMQGSAGELPAGLLRDPTFRMSSRSRKGAEPLDWPADLRVREMPEVRR